MKTDTSSGSATGCDGDVPVSVCFDLLSSTHRRRALRYLSSRVGSISLVELDEHLALCDGVTTDDGRDRLSIELRHVHLPKLVDAGVVRYAPDDERVERRASAAQLDPILSLVEGRDLTSDTSVR